VQCITKISQTTAQRDYEFLRKSTTNELKSHIQNLGHEYQTFRNDPHLVVPYVRKGLYRQNWLLLTFLILEDRFYSNSDGIQR
jgi:hypothetical protein